MTGRKPKTVDDEQRKQVRTMAAYGMPQKVIGVLTGHSPKTLRKHFRMELDYASEQANAEMAGYLFKNGKNGNVSAQIFWMKTRAGWKEPPQGHQHSGAIGSYDLSKVSDADLKRLEAILGSAVPVSNTGGD